jgi:hypothetical protein
VLMCLLLPKRRFTRLCMLLVLLYIYWQLAVV